MASKSSDSSWEPEPALHGPVNRVTVKVLGDEYVIRTKAKPEEIARVAAYVDSCLKRIMESAPQVGMRRAAVLVALNAVYELQAAKEKLEDLARKKSSTNPVSTNTSQAGLQVEEDEDR